MFDSFTGLVHPLDAVEQETISGREGRGIRDSRTYAHAGQQMPQRNLTPRAVSISIHVRREGHSHPWDQEVEHLFGRPPSGSRYGDTTAAWTLRQISFTAPKDRSPWK